MADNAKFNALGNKIKEHAAANAANNAEESGEKRGLFGFGKPKTESAATTAKPTATITKPTATITKPTKPTVTTAAVKTAFTDVPANAYYAEAVAWALQKNITSGTTENTFSPNNPCHRGHAATFLWRSKGSPAPRTKLNPYSDVAEDSPFYKAILWAAENKIIEAKSANTFDPTAQCTRGEVLTYLYRAEGKAKATEADAVKWAGTKNLLAGFTGSATSACTRADIVTFLYRVKNK